MTKARESRAAAALRALDGDRVVRLTQALIRHPSPDPPGQEGEIAGFIQGTLSELGIASHLTEFAPGRVNLVARIGGTGERSGLIFSAHFDTMPVGQQAWAHPPFEGVLLDGRIHGRGASDMKSGMASMVGAAAAVVRSGVSRRGDLILAFSAGESTNLIGAKHLIASGVLHGAGALLVSEPTSLELVTAEKGALWIRAVATGRSGHLSSGGADENAIVKMTDFLARLRRVQPEEPAHPLLGTPTIGIGTIHGGTVVNLTPDECVAELDVRVLPEKAPETVLEQLHAVSEGAIRFDIIDFKPPVVTELSHPFVRLCQDACEAETGVRPRPKGASYYSDAAVLGPALNLPMVILGPGELGMSGAQGEYAEVAKIVTAARILTRIAVDYL